jgi:hypothetical protein
MTVDKDIMEFEKNGLGNSENVMDFFALGGVQTMHYTVGYPTNRTLDILGVHLSTKTENYRYKWYSIAIYLQSRQSTLLSSCVLRMCNANGAQTKCQIFMAIVFIVRGEVFKIL